MAFTVPRMRMFGKNLIESILKARSENIHFRMAKLIVGHWNVPPFFALIPF